MNIRLVLSRCLTVGAVAVCCLGRSHWHAESPFALALESTAVAFLLVGAIGRIWCSVHIAGRKNAEVVAHGPYSVCRNPLYFFSMFAFMGAGLAFESLGAFAIFTAVFFLMCSRSRCASPGSSRLRSSAGRRSCSRTRPACCRRSSRCGSAYFSAGAGLEGVVFAACGFVAGCVLMISLATRSADSVIGPSSSPAARAASMTSFAVTPGCFAR